jgi:hypothetical protein
MGASDDLSGTDSADTHYSGSPAYAERADDSAPMALMWMERQRASL